MKAVRNTADGIRVLEVPEPADRNGVPPVEVTVVSTAICGSDLHLMAMGPSPVTPGHEFAGLLPDGTPVAVRPYLPCDACDQCAAGAGQLCRTGGERLLGVAIDGGMAERVRVDPGALFPLVDTSGAGVDPRDGALVEPLAVALHGLNRAGVTAGRRVLVIGGGPIGLCAVAAARHLGADVDLTEPRPHRAEAGEALGARIRATGEYDTVLDAAAVQSSFDLAVAHLRPRGTLGLLGTFWTPVAMDYTTQMKEITIVPAFMYGHHHGAPEFAQATDILRAVPDLPRVLITHRFPLDEAARAFAVAQDPAAAAIKVVLEP
ncbi:zinc-binding dehydrogenase [Embleya sp. NPDC059213]|uniref:zinc-dependent alcohol dehydrogenase n=5 Tax=Embleya TaxID=2699295 RepID=UPI0033D9DED0